MAKGVGAARGQRFGRCQRTTTRRETGEESEFDVTIDSEWYQSFCIDELIPTIRLKMPWLKGKTSQSNRTAPLLTLGGALHKY